MISVPTGAKALIADGIGVGREDAAVVIGHARRAHVIEIRLDDGIRRRTQDTEFTSPAQNVGHVYPPCCQIIPIDTVTLNAAADKLRSGPSGATKEERFADLSMIGPSAA